MNTHIIPTPHEIDAVIFDIIAVEAARVPDDTVSTNSGPVSPWIQPENFEGIKWKAPDVHWKE